MTTVDLNDDVRTVLAELDRQGTKLRGPVVEAARRLRETVMPGLFDRPLANPATNTPGRSHGGDTETRAAWNEQPRTGTTRMRVLEAIAAAGPDGCTDQELEDRLGMNRPTPGNRRGELVTGGWVRDSGRRRPTHAGNPAVVWVLTDQAAERIAEDWPA